VLAALGKANLRRFCYENVDFGQEVDFSCTIIKEDPGFIYSLEVLIAQMNELVHNGIAK
jgi:hypothetical protein